MKKIITESNIILNAKFDNKWDAIRTCGNILFEEGYVSKSYVEDMIEREKQATIYIGNHVAIPHGTNKSKKDIYSSGLSFVQITEGVNFENEKAFIMIGIAGKDNTHIKLLSKIAQVCMDIENVKLLRYTNDKSEIIRLLGGIDSF